MLSDEALVKWKFENAYSFTHRQKVRKNFRLQKGVDMYVEVSLEPSLGKTPFSSGLCLSFSSHHSSLAHPTQHMHGRMTHCCSHDMSPGHHGEALPLLPASALRSTPPFEIRPLAVGFICLRLVVSVTNFAYILANFLSKNYFTLIHLWRVRTMTQVWRLDGSLGKLVFFHHDSRRDRNQVIRLMASTFTCWASP